ncbi:FAD:protein FMN transferase [Salinibacterium sp. G-O1]|uniref:FAD:protein FMN transferase n=1 Tax=Salinibacterium sp. G-O1 TaxID=3046208 RepID=UPI0024B98A4E|nr:FAD:protein FMN transferase [Salinibacterium sp. G-O1]MDJ0334650.1 FAD:protein FMN transferase [Salinibacterium sp. G-O1]
MRHVLCTMGTVASIELPEAYASELDDVDAVFRDVDERFSLYRPESELSRIANGTVALGLASAELRSSYERSIEWRIQTGGLFTPNRPDGVLDLNGIVKAEAIESAGALLDRAGCPAWTINVGGDILVRSNHAPWVTGIADPADPDALLCSVEVGGARRAIATSGCAQRGDHIWRGGELGPTHFAQVSVIAGDIVTADVLATAIVAGGPAAIDQITDRWPVDVLAVDRAGAMVATPGFRRSLAA